jgi:drug/metabolite transporter (DMT)-like permease
MRPGDPNHPDPLDRLGAPRHPLAYTALSAASFAAMALFTRMATRTLAGDQVAFLRFALMLLPLLAVPTIARKAVTWRRFDLLLYRGVFGGVAVLLYFLALEHVPMGTATLLNYSSPIFSVLFAALFLGERVRALVLAPAALALAGVALVTGIDGGDLVARIGRWEVAGMVSAVLSGAAVAAIRAARKTEGSWAIYGSFTVCGLAAAAPFAIAGWRAPSAREWFLLAAIGATSIVAQLSMTYAYRWVTNVQSGAFSQVTVLLSYALGALFLAEPFGPLQLAGAALTLVGVLGVIWIQAPPRAVE